MNKLFRRLVLFVSIGISGSVWADTQQEWAYSMQPGDSVWSIAHELLTDWREWKTVERLNNVRNDRRMPPGTVLRIPRGLISERRSDIKILEVAGTVTAEVLMKEGTAKARLPLVRGQSLGRGDLLKTAQQSTVLLEFDDGTQVLILEKSVVRIDEAIVVGNKRKVVDIKVFLEEGEAEIRANPAKVPGSKFLIETPAVFATTRGTTYRVRADGDVTTAEVTDGKISVENTLGQTEVRKGFGTLAKADSAPVKPKKLLPAPELPVLDQPIRYLPGKLKWSVHEGAAEYRSQISPDEGFTSVVYDVVSSQPKMGLPVSLQDQTYWLKVSAISEEGLQGFSSTRQINIDARPFPPVRQAPRPSDSIYVGQVEFAWSRPELADTFLLELALDAEFSQSAQQFKGIKSTHHTVSIAVPGAYFWRVSSVTEAGKVGPEGYAGQFSVKPVPPKPEMREPVTSDDQIFFSWQEEQDVVAYQFQFSDDPEFKTPLIDEKTDKAEFAIDKPESGTYYMRVRSFDADDYAGEWTEPQKVVQSIENWWPVIITGAASILFML